MKTVIDMAKECQLLDGLSVVPSQVERFAELVLAAERNHIAGVFEDNHEVVKPKLKEKNT